MVSEKSAQRCSIWRQEFWANMLHNYDSIFLWFCHILSLWQHLFPKLVFINFFMSWGIGTWCPKVHLILARKVNSAADIPIGYPGVFNGSNKNTGSAAFLNSDLVSSYTSFWSITKGVNLKKPSLSFLTHLSSLWTWIILLKGKIWYFLFFFGASFLPKFKPP